MKWLFENLPLGDAIVITLAIAAVAIYLISILIYLFQTRRTSIKLNTLRRLAELTRAVEEWDAELNDRIDRSGMNDDYCWYDVRKLIETEIEDDRRLFDRRKHGIG